MLKVTFVRDNCTRDTTSMKTEINGNSNAKERDQMLFKGL